MFSKTLIAAACLALVNTAYAAECDTTKLMGLASSTNLAGCTKDTGVSVDNIGSITADQAQSICASTSCMGLFDDIKSLDLGDCTLPGTNVSVQTDVLGNIGKLCGGSGMGSMDMSSGSMDMTMGSGSSTGATTVGDASGDSSSTGDKVSGGSTASASGSSGAAATAVGCVSTIAFVLVSAML